LKAYAEGIKNKIFQKDLILQTEIMEVIYQLTAKIIWLIKEGGVEIF